MTKGLKRSIQRGGTARSIVRKGTFILKNLAINVDGVTGIGFGTAVLGDFPVGNILLLGAMSYIQISKGVAAGTIDTFAGNYSVGSAPTADAVLSGAEVDVIPSTALAAATAGVSPLTRGVQAAQAMLDNTDDSLELNLNLLIDDASISANTQGLIANGVVEVLYSVLLDD